MIDSLEIARRMAVIQDSGPIYNEFVHDATVHEPWNAYSSLIFFIPVIFWIWRLRGEYGKNAIIVALLPLLFLNGLGSTLFHAFRTYQAFLLLDWLPAAIMSFTLASYFWTKIWKKWYWGVLSVLAFYFLAFFAIALTSMFTNVGSFAPNIGYFFIGCCIFIPILLVLRRNNFRFWGYVVSTIIFLVLALACRTLDYPTPNPFPETLPQGTHFLWHVFSSFAVFSLGFFIYFTNQYERGEEIGKIFRKKS